MASVQINSKDKIDFKELIKGFSQLQTSDIEQFMLEVSNIVAKRKASNYSKRESELLIAINNSYPIEQSKEIKRLQHKLQEGTMNKQEHQHYLELLEESEKRSVKRLEYLIELAGLRKIPLPILMNQLGLNPATRA